MSVEYVELRHHEAPSTNEIWTKDIVELDPESWVDISLALALPTSGREEREKEKETNIENRNILQ